MQYILLIYGLLLVSPIVAYIFGGAKFIVLFLLPIIILILLKTKRNIEITWLIALFISVLFILVPTFYWQEGRIFAVTIYYFISLILVVIVVEKEVVGFVHLSTFVLIFLCVGALLSFFYALLGGAPLWGFPNPDGRENYLYLLSLTNSVWGGFIRPSAIYDEPGAFSFFICSVVTLRVLLGFDKKLTWFLALSGLITFSLAHIIFFVFFALSQKVRLKHILLTVLVCLIFVSIVINLGYYDIFESVFLIRFELDSDGSFRGDNRSSLMFAALDLIRQDYSVLLWGLSPESYLNSEEYLTKSGYPDIGSNPLSPLVRMGIFLSLPYYIVVSLCLVFLLKGRKYMVVFGMGLLLMQRDYLFVVSYGLVVLLIIKSAFGFNKGITVGPQVNSVYPSIQSKC